MATVSDVDPELSSPGLWESSEIRRRLPLTGRSSVSESVNPPSVVASTVLQSVGGASSAASIMSQVALGALGPGQSLFNPRPSVIAEVCIHKKNVEYHISSRLLVEFFDAITFPMVRIC